MDLDPPPPAPVADGARIKVSVYADMGSLRAGEEGETVAVPLPLGQDHIDVNVWLVVEEPFAVEGEDTRKLTLRRDQARSETLEFTVVRNGSGTAPTALFSALFAYKGRPCGRVSRAVALAAGTDSVQVPLPDPAVQVETGAKAADLQVRIVRSGTDEQTFECHVQTPLLPAYADGVAGPWRLSSLARDLVREQMSHFTTKGATLYARTVALLGAGYNLFEATPPLFQKVFWELLDAGRPLRSISIVTEEPYIPWELLVPNRTLLNGETEEWDQPLGVEFVVSRWTSRSHVAAPQKISLRDAYVIAPKESRLPEAEEEATLVMAQFAGKRVDPASLEVLDQTLDQGGRALLHFICHGVSGEAGSQTLQMDQNQKLYAESLRGMRGVKKACKASKPVIFLNACEVGREEPALVGTGGFAETFMSLGASAVIAPLWSVKDTVAHEIAVEFYRRIKAEPATPLAAILRDLRAKSYVAGGGEDSYAAYCFYGDPLATAG
ncbi:MAG TPA: CHAT domain-containing protein [Thermoanaerobaculia bacterium]|nr:CHAT domain-containing protein [Thermoanaerobaculia bacterium]